MLITYLTFATYVPIHFQDPWNIDYTPFFKNFKVNLEIQCSIT